MNLLILKQHYVEIAMLCDFAPPHSFWVQHHYRKLKFQVYNSL